MAGVGCDTATQDAGPRGVDNSTAPPVTEGLCFQDCVGRLMPGPIPGRAFHYSGGLVVGWHRYGVAYSVSDNLSHFPYPLQIGEHVVFALLIVDSLAIHEHFHDALPSRRDGHGNVRAKVSEKLIRHPRGGTEVLSTNAVSDLYLDFPFH